MNIEDFLKETKFCDFSNPEIKKLAEKLNDNNLDEREQAVKVFYWVRDNILYRVGNWNKKASETLEEEEGTCTNKANLMAALLRYMNIPAGYGVMRVKGREYFGSINLLSLSRKISENSIHIYSYVYIDKKWIKCDSSDDEKLSRNSCHLNPQSKIVDWSGDCDCLLNFSSDHVLSDKGPISDIDDLMKKKIKKGKKIFVEIGNLYISFLRSRGVMYSKIENIEKDFNKWLWKNSKYKFVIFSFANVWFKFHDRFF